jgi:Spy/CpxP family protein refolding chaperone
MFRKCVFAAALLLGAWVLALMAQQGEKAPVPTELPKDWRE